MLAALVTIVVIFGLAAALCIGAFMSLAGAVVTVLAGPFDRAFHVPARPAGFALAAFGVLLFAAALLALLGAAPHP